MLGLNKEWGYSHLNFSSYNDLQEIPDGSRDSTTSKFTKQVTEDDMFRPIVTDSELNTYKISPLHQHIRHYKLYSSNNLILGNAGRISIEAGFQQNIRQEFSHPGIISVPGLDLVLTSLTYDIKYFLPELHGWELITGINGMYQKNLNRGSEFIIPDYSQVDFSPFLVIKKTSGRLDISGGLRLDLRLFSGQEMHTGKNPLTGFDMIVNSIYSTLAFSKSDRTFSGLTGSIGAAFNFSGNMSVKADIARGYRSPNISEISANGVHPGTGIYQVGNLDKPEFSLQENLGLFFNTRYINGSVELFNNNLTNYIFNQKLHGRNGGDSVITRGTATYKFQQSDAHINGGEVNLDIHPNPLDWLHFENSLSFILAENKGANGLHINDSTRYLPFIPPLHFHSELRAGIKMKILCFSGLYLKISLDHFASQYRVYLENGTETPTAWYTLLNSGFGSDIRDKHGRRLMSIMVIVDNITNIAYQSHLSRLKYMDFYVSKEGTPVTVSRPGSGIYNMGRNISIKVSVP